jgi:hypothetical protein
MFFHLAPILWCCEVKILIADTESWMFIEVSDFSAEFAELANQVVEIDCILKPIHFQDLRKKDDRQRLSK